MITHLLNIHIFAITWCITQVHYCNIATCINACQKQLSHASALRDALPCAALLRFLRLVRYEGCSVEACLLSSWLQGEAENVCSNLVTCASSSSLLHALGNPKQVSWPALIDAEPACNARNSQFLKIRSLLCWRMPSASPAQHWESPGR